MKVLTLFSLVICIVLSSCVEKEPADIPESTRMADSVLALMTLDEKIGQMAQLSGHEELTGVTDTTASYVNELMQGRVGSLLNVNGAENTRKMQKLALDNSRLKIPLIFGYDVIHGYKTIFPIPLAEACSWDLEAIKKSARVAAIEASAAGQHWTFAPMVDIARDARWGRIMEGAGEDPYLGIKVANARVKGFQGEDLSDHATVLACAKHYAGYGFSEGGRDYNVTEISERTLRELILPPFKACIEANVATFMTAFNDLNGIPASGNKMLGDILRKEWQYDGLVVSDWNSVGDMLIHGIAANKEEAAQLSLGAGVDMDMEGHVYTLVLKKLVENNLVSQEQIDHAVFRILKTKFELGLFDDPYRYCDVERERLFTLSIENREAARDVAMKSIVLLKNNNQLLPLSKNINSIALIGPLAATPDDILGNWRGRGSKEDAVSVLVGLKNKFPGAQINYAKGCEIDSTDKSGFEEALKIAKNSDVILLAIGEGGRMSGEAHSRTFLGLPGVQLELLKALKSIKKPIVVLLMNGRPLAIPETVELSDALLETWFLGTEAGNAIADVLTGDYNPSGKLTVSFPNTSGQVPIYYNHKNTGRPGNPGPYTSRYDDAPIKPLFPFGFGLSYTTFAYSDIQLSSQSIKFNQELFVSVTVKNTGSFDGYEVVQLYVRDVNGSVTRPVKELKGFEKVFVPSGKSKTVTFILQSDDLAFWGRDMKFKAEKGVFKVMVGTNSVDFLEGEFELKN